MIIAVDFDGTLHDGQYPAIGEPLKDAIEIMLKLKREGHYLIINTCRCDERLLEAINWMLEMCIPFDKVNENHTGNIAKYASNSRKIYAHLYVDDKQIGGLPPWKEIYEYINSKELEYVHQPLRTLAEH